MGNGTLDDVREHFGPRVAELVACVTENPDLPLTERKLAYREGVRRSPDGARAICAADKVCNVSDLHEAASDSAEQVLARFAGGLDAQVSAPAPSSRCSRRPTPTAVCATRCAPSSAPCAPRRAAARRRRASAHALTKP